MLFSIVVCTYNNASSLEATLESLGALRMPDQAGVELCIVDNNSTDGTAQVSHHFLQRAPFPVRYFFEPQQGLSHARNRGIAEAAGDVIVFTDDDVLVPPDWLVRYASSFVKHGADAAYGRISPEWRGRCPTFFSPRLNHVYALLDYGPEPFFVTARWQEFYGANFAVKTGLLRDLGGFDARLGRKGTALLVGEERQVFIKLRERNAKIRYDPENEVFHVIAEHRKNEAFLRKYFADIASSMVMMDTLQARRWFFGMPMYRWRELSSFAILLPLRWLKGSLCGSPGYRLHLKMRCLMMRRLVWLFLSRALGNKQPRHHKT